jgi:hypothetical protein
MMTLIIEGLLVALGISAAAMLPAKSVLTPVRVQSQRRRR